MNALSISLVYITTGFLKNLQSVRWILDGGSQDELSRMELRARLVRPKSTRILLLYSRDCGLRWEKTTGPRTRDPALERTSAEIDETRSRYEYLPRQSILSFQIGALQ